jgi:hypothetical protein
MGNLNTKIELLPPLDAALENSKITKRVPRNPRVGFGANNFTEINTINNNARD